MESELNSEREALSNVDTIRARTALVPREHAVLQLAFTVLMAGYMGVFVYAGSIKDGLAGNAITLVIPPIIILSGLISGANERFRARQRAGVRQWLASGFFVVVFMILLGWGIAWSGYPWWIALVAVVATLVIFGSTPVRVLLRTSGAVREPEVPRPLSRPVRIITTLLGAYLGLACAVVLIPRVASIVMIVGMLGVILLLMAQTLPWGILRTGYEWRRPQWIGFGVAATVLFALAVLILATDIVTPLIAICAGVVVAAASIASTFVPRQNHVAPAS